MENYKFTNVKTVRIGRVNDDDEDRKKHQSNFIRRF